MSVDFVHDAGFKSLQLFLGQRIRFGDDGHDVDFVMQRLHEGHVQRLESVARGRDEVEAAMHAVVADVAAVETRLVLQVLLKLLVDVSDDGLEAAVVVDGIPVARSVDDRQAETDATLLDLNLFGEDEVIKKRSGNRERDDEKGREEEERKTKKSRKRGRAGKEEAAAEGGIDGKNDRKRKG